MNIGKSFIALFTTMNAITIICLICGLILVIVELFQPGFGIFGVSGGILLVVGIILQAVKSGGDILQVVILIFFLLLILTIAFLIMMRSLKYGWLSRSPIVQKEIAVSEGLTEGTQDFSFLLEKEGVTKTVLRPVGKAEIDGEEYDVIAYQGAMYNEDVKVKVIETEGQRIIVKKI